MFHSVDKISEKGSHYQTFKRTIRDALAQTERGRKVLQILTQMMEDENAAA